LQQREEGSKSGGGKRLAAHKGEGSWVRGKKPSNWNAKKKKDEAGVAKRRTGGKDSFRKTEPHKKKEGPKGAACKCKEDGFKFPEEN